MLFTDKTTIRVRYAETDQMGIVYHSNYLVWFEIARTELFRGFNLPYTLFEEEGLGLAVVDVKCRYRKPAHYDDIITIVANLEQLTARGAKFSYEIYRENDLLVQGETRHVFINKEGRPASAQTYPIWSKVNDLLVNREK